MNRRFFLKVFTLPLLSPLFFSSSKSYGVEAIAKSSSISGFLPGKEERKLYVEMDGWIVLPEDKNFLWEEKTFLDKAEEDVGDRNFIDKVTGKLGYLWNKTAYKIDKALFH